MPVVIQEGNTATFAFDQDLVETTIPAIRQELLALLSSCSKLCLDLNLVRTMDTVGAGLLVAVRNSLGEKNGSLTLANVSEDQMRLLKSMRLEQHLNLAG